MSVSKSISVHIKVTISKGSRYVGSMFLQRRSLVLLSDEAYSHYLHGIDDRLVDQITDKVFNRNIAGLELGREIKRELRYSCFQLRNIHRLSSFEIIVKEVFKTEDFFFNFLFFKIIFFLFFVFRLSLTIRYVPKVSQRNLFGILMNR